MIQARSLANVVQLADNPPLDYQSSLPDEHADPLTLYIVRVPGSKDVFLTTIKPPSKVVRAEDVQNCLYYVHVDSANDERLLRDEESRLRLEKEERVWNIAEENTGVPVVRRKPLPSRPVTQVGEAPEPPPKSYPHFQQPATSASDGSLEARLSKSADCGPIVQRGPLTGPRPMVQVQRSRNLYRQKQVDLDLLYKSNGEMPSIATKVVEEAHTTEQEEFDSSSLTLVRRYAGEQSNVCRIDQSCQLQVFASLYDKDGLLRPLHQPESVSSGTHEHHVEKYFTTALDSSRKASLNQSEPGFDASVSSDSYSGMDVRRYRKHLSEITNTYRQNSPQAKAPAAGGYTFTTPWGGTCQFTTAFGARAFKCKHSSSSRLEPSTISELRPDLPSAPAARSGGTGMQMSQNPRRKSLFDNRKENIAAKSPFRHSVDIASLTTNEQKELSDLSLGQERAGGGFGGKLAKLGKLIIHPEGFQMLDLLVGANMALWWKMYDKDA